MERGYDCMRLNDDVYRILKWFTLVVIPAGTTFYVALSAIWGFPFASEVAKTSAAVCALLGSLLGISTAEYYKDEPGEDWLDDPIEENKE